jgi:hypothetical protein
MTIDHWLLYFLMWAAAIKKSLVSAYHEAGYIFVITVLFISAPKLEHVHIMIVYLIIGICTLFPVLGSRYQNTGSHILLEWQQQHSYNR